MLKEFMKVAGDGKKEDDGSDTLLDMNFFTPYPKKFQEQDDASTKWREDNPDKPLGQMDGYNNDGYEWCIKNWGCKWNFSEVNVSEKSRSLLYFFQTPWGPPLPIIEKMSIMFPHLRFTIKYYECGSAFQGKMVFRDGKILTNQESEYYGRRGG